LPGGTTGRGMVDGRELGGGGRVVFLAQCTAGQRRTPEPKTDLFLKRGFLGKRVPVGRGKK